MLQASVEVRGVTVRYRQWGSADRPVLVLAHGLPDGSFVWGPVAEGVEHLRRVIAPDLPAFGDTAAPHGFDWSVGSLTGLFEGFLEAVGLNRFDLGVHDISGAYGLAAAGRRPEAVDRLVVFNSNAFTGWRWHALARRYRAPVLGRLMTLPLPEKRFRALLDPAFAGPVPRWYADAVWKGWRRPETRRAIMRFYRVNDERDWAEAERALTALRGKPALVVWGERDRFVTPRFADRFGDALGARVVRLDTGHFPMVEDPDAVLAELRPFLAG